MAASSFHWVEEDVGLGRLHAALEPRGRFAMWWTLFGDPDEPDAFIEATSPLLAGLDASPTQRESGRPRHALDREARLEALAGAGFEDGRYELAVWHASWDAQGIRGLYATFSPIARLDDTRKAEILDAVERIARDDFGSRVERTLLTPIYVARKPG